jgi:hypothetical protein
MKIVIYNNRIPEGVYSADVRSDVSCTVNRHGAVPSHRFLEVQLGGGKHFLKLSDSDSPMQASILEGKGDLSREWTNVKLEVVAYNPPKLKAYPA